MSRSLLYTLAAVVLLLNGCRDQEQASPEADDDAVDHHATQNAFDPKRWPLDKAVENVSALMLYEHKEFEKLHFQLRINLWYSIVDLERFTRDESIAPELREQAKGQLEGIAKYFAENPKKHLVPENEELAKRIREEFNTAQENQGEDADQVSSELRKGFDPLIAGFLDGLMEFHAQAYARDLETQAIVDRINAEQDGESDS